MSGSNTTGALASTGRKGTASASNVPGNRFGAVWIDVAVTWARRECKAGERSKIAINCNSLTIDEFSPRINRIMSAPAVLIFASKRVRLFEPRVISFCLAFNLVGRRLGY